MSDSDLPESHPDDEKKVLIVTFPLSATDEHVEDIRKLSDQTLEKHAADYAKELDVEVFDRLDNVVAAADGYYAAVYSNEITKIDKNETH